MGQYNTYLDKAATLAVHRHKTSHKRKSRKKFISVIHFFSCKYTERWYLHRSPTVSVNNNKIIWRFLFVCFSSLLLACNNDKFHVDGEQIKMLTIYINDNALCF